MKVNKQYMLSLVKPVNPAIDFPIQIVSTGMFSYQYKIMHSDFYGTKLPRWKGMLHMLLFMAMSKARRIRVFTNKKVLGKLILVELSSENSSQKCS